MGNRRFVVTGDRAYEGGAEDGTYPATGWHIRGEMGGFWSQPIKLLDGVWFAADGAWLTARRFTEHPGYTTMTLAGPGVRRRMWLGVVSCVLAPIAAHAQAKVLVSPAAAAGVVFDDNLFSTPKTEALSDGILRVTPGLSASRETRRSGRPRCRCSMRAA